MKRDQYIFLAFTRLEVHFYYFFLFFTRIKTRSSDNIMQYNRKEICGKFHGAFKIFTRRHRWKSYSVSIGLVNLNSVFFVSARATSIAEGMRAKRICLKSEKTVTLEKCVTKPTQVCWPISATLCNKTCSVSVALSFISTSLINNILQFRGYAHNLIFTANWFVRMTFWF